MDFLVKMLYLWGSTMGEVRREQEQEQVTNVVGDNPALSIHLVTNEEDP
jgi:hypothetical protein